MSSTKPKKGNKQSSNSNKNSSGWIDVKSNNQSPSAKRKRRRKKAKNANNTNNNNANKIKTRATAPKHAAPPNAATIYCQWYQEGICHRGKDCFFIHELDPMSEKNPIEHKKMLKKLLSPNKTKSKSSQNVQVQLKKPPKPQQTDKFILPSQNKTMQGKNGNKKYNRYSDFDPNAGSNQNQNPNQNQVPQPQQPPNPYAIPMQIPIQQTMYAPNPYLAPMQMQMPIQMAIPITMVNLPVSPTNNTVISNDSASLNANAVEFVPNFGAPQVQIQPQFIVPVQVQSPIANMNINGIQSPMANMNINPNGNSNGNPSTPMKSPPAGYNPYLIAGNAPNMNPYGMNGMNGNSKQVQDQTPCKFNAEDELINNPDAFNEDDYEVFEDENGEIIVVEKDQLYGSDPEYHDQKMLREYNKQRAMDNGNNTYSQRGIRAGGQTYVYGANPNNHDYDEHKNIDSYDNDNGSGSPSNRRKKKKTRRGGKGRNKNKNKGNGNGNGSGYASAAAKFGNIYPTKGKVESFDADQHSNPDYDPNAKICRFWLSARCAYGENCKMAHRFETNSCPHCDKHVGKSPLMQQQHLQQCSSKTMLDEENKMSENQECGICRENIIDKGSKFGLLTGCQHAFCLKCIREWRGVLNQSKDVVRSCPICRQITWFIVPCDRFVKDQKRKEEIITKYKSRLSNIRCKHFDDDEECPFGSSCFYKHVRKDGTVDDKKVNLRHMINADGETEIMKQMRLSEFLFGE